MRQFAKLVFYIYYYYIDFCYFTLMIERLKEIKLVCNDCDNKSVINYDFLLNKFPDFEEINLGNLNQLVKLFICKSCQGKNFQILDFNDELLFDLQSSVICEICGLFIPFPRIEIFPGTKKCIDCKDEIETKIDYDPIKFPEVPKEIKGDCKRCREGTVVTRYNSKKETFFLSCSRFPKCWWSTNKYFNKLNN